MSFPKYPKYKDSGVEWLGDVPEHWDVKTVRHACQIDNTLRFPIDKQTRSDLEGEYRYYGPTGVLSWINEYRVEGEYFLLGEDGDHFLKFNTQAMTILVEGKFNVNNHAHVVRGVGECSTEWACRYFEHKDLLPWLIKQGVGRYKLRKETLQTIPIVVPPENEQTAIAAFLDAETSKIDALIAEQRRLIELLKEKRQAVISHAVTKGLNPNAPMRPSGIEWLGDVPEHWDVKKLKKVAFVRTGVAKGKDLSGRNTITVPYLRVANVQDGYLDLDEISTIQILHSELERYRLMAGDVLMNEGGDFDKLGRGHVWEGQIDPCITQNHVFAVRPTAVTSKWLNTITGSDYAQFFFMTRSKQSTNLASISSTNLMDLPVIIPPTDEQHTILSFIERTTGQFDALLSEATRAIDLLQERRTALISAAVTGKIDVREFASVEAA